MSKDETRTDSKGRARRPEQDDALAAFNERRRHGEDIVSAGLRAAADREAMAWFKTLTSRQRGEIIEQAYEQQTEGE